MNLAETDTGGPGAIGDRASARLRASRCILMVGSHLVNSMGGVRAVVQGYIEGGLFERFDCTYVATHRSGGRWIKARTAVAAWLKVAYQLARLDAPLVHVMLASRASFWRKSVICLMARAARRPYLLHVHGAEFALFYHRECGALGKRFVRSIFSGAALVLALSEEWRAELRRICPDARIEVLHNAVAMPDPALLERATASEPTILFLGELGKRKGTYELVRAFARIAPQAPSARLRCAGDGDIEGVRALAAELGLEDRVECPGWLDAPEKRAALRDAAVFALPSHAEGMPMALLDAMAWGLPVVATPVGGVPQIIEPGRNGLLVQPGDIDGLAAALLQLLSDAALRARLGSAARATIENGFSLSAALERLAGIYQRLGVTPAARSMSSTL